MLQPLAPHESLINKAVDLFHPSTYAYLLGNDILVSPITANSTNGRTETEVCERLGVTVGCADMTLTDATVCVGDGR